MLPKNLRVVDKKLLAEIRLQPCAACGQKPVDAAHIRSRGAGGDDTPDNLLPLCRSHHVEQHKRGWHLMSDKYPNLRFALAVKGWEIIEGKLNKKNAV
jgi:predicted restriction endonuclease